MAELINYRQLSHCHACHSVSASTQLQIQIDCFNVWLITWSIMLKCMLRVVTRFVQISVFNVFGWCCGYFHGKQHLNLQVWSKCGWWIIRVSICTFEMWSMINIWSNMKTSENPVNCSLLLHVLFMNFSASF